MKKSSKIIITSIVGIGLLAGAASFAHSRGVGHGFGHGCRGNHMVEHMSERLDLDAEQEQRLDAIFAQMRDLRREAMQSRRDSMIEVASLLEAPNLDQARTLEVFSAKIDSMEQRAPQLIATVAQFTDSLTPEQKQQAKDMLERRFERHGDDLK